MNSRVKKSVFAFALGLVNSMSQMLTRYHSDAAGVIEAKPEYFVGRPLNASVSEDLSEGVFVVRVSQAAQASDEEDGPTALFDLCPAGAKPHGYLERRDGEILMVRTLRGDVTISGITSGADYVVGTDSKPAKVGGSNYPTGVTSPYVVGIGWLTDVLMFSVAGSQDAVTPFAGATEEDSAVFDSDVQGYFDQILEMDLTQLNVGDEVEVTGLVKLEAPNTVTFTPVVLIGNQSIFLGDPIDPTNAGDVLGFMVRLIVRAIGSSGKFISWGIASVNGDISTAKATGGGNGDETTLNFTQTAAVLKAGGAFSAAGANSAILRLLKYRKI